MQKCNRFLRSGHVSQTIVQRINAFSQMRSGWRITKPYQRDTGIIRILSILLNPVLITFRNLQLVRSRWTTTKGIPMPAYKNLSTSIAFAIALPALSLAVPAAAKETRSATSLPKVSLVAYGASNGRPASSLPRDVGPKKGWPVNHGIENAWEHANEHSAHHRNCSDG